MFAVRLAWILILAVQATAGLSAERVALVIGNGRYEAVAPLSNPGNDASDIAAALERLGFSVTQAGDLGAREMSLALRDFSRLAVAADMALIYYAGHGMEIDNRNYLIPVDARLERASDVPFEATDLDMLLQAVQGAETLRLVLLDACRNNPFLTQMADARSRSLGQGLARIEPTGGVLVGYAAKGGTIAYDGAGRNSPYAAALLQHIEAPGLEIGQFFRRVRDTVYRETDGLQEPFTYGSLPAADIYLAAQPAHTSRLDVLQAFAAADIANSVAGWQTFIETFAQTREADDLLPRARQKLAMLQRPAAAPGPAPAAAPALPTIAALDDSPLIRACDRLAADPGDEARPEGVTPIEEEDLDAEAARTACLLATSGHPTHARSGYQLARVLLALGETSSGMSLMEEVARQGYNAARTKLALELIYLGQTGEIDRERAVSLLEAATADGSAVAPRMLGDYHARVFASLNEAVSYYQIAAERGDPHAKFEIGYRLVSLTLGTPEERREGVRLLEEAAAAGVPNAQLRLANLYFDDGSERDRTRAIYWLEQSARNGDRNATIRLIRIFSEGDAGIPASLEKAAEFTELAASRGSAMHMVRAGYMNEVGRGVPVNRAKAARYYFEALENRSTFVVQRRASDWDLETARALQRLLRGSPQARYTGVIDGIVGGGTRAAMQRLCECSPRRFDMLFANVL